MFKAKHSSFKKKSILAIIWSGVDSLLSQGFQFVVAIILARLLSPEQFGTIALLYLFTGIASTFSDCGFSAALIQRKNTNIEDESTVFWFNLLMGSVMTLCLWCISPWIAKFYQIEELLVITRILAFTIIINAFGSVHNILFIKNLNFKSIMKVNVVTTISSGLLAIYLAKEGYGIWALVSQALLASIISTLLLWAFSSWRPKLIFSLQSAKNLFGFGAYLMAANILDTIYNKLYTLLIGKMHGISDLGIYERANNTQKIPVDLLSGIFAKVAFPIFSAANDDIEKLHKGGRLAVRGLMLINVPTMLGLLATADNFILTLFGEQWLSSVPLLQVLCISGIFWPLHVINLELLKAQGFSNLFFRLELIKKIGGTLFLVTGIFYYGVLGLAWSVATFSLVGLFINAFYTGIHLNYGAIKQLKDVLTIVFISILMAAVTFYAGQFIIDSAIMVLFQQVVVGACVYTLFCVIFQIKAYKAMLNLFSRKK